MFGIGLINNKTEMNIGTLWRSAFLYNANFIFTINKRYKKQSSDTQKTVKHIPLFHFIDWQDFLLHRPFDAELVCIEYPSKEKLQDFKHPKSAIYLLGAEDNGIPKEILNKSQHIIEIPTIKQHSMNVAVAGSIVMYDRIIKK